MNTMIKEEYVAKSLAKGFNALSDDEKAQAILDDHKHYHNGCDKSILSEEDLDKVNHLTNCINKTVDLVVNIRDLISIFKKYDGFFDYEIIAGLIYRSKDLKISDLEFVKEFIIKPYYNKQQAKIAKPNKPFIEKVEAAKDMSVITASDIVRNCNAIGHTNQMNQPAMQAQPNPVNMIAPIHPEMTLDQKVEIIRSHIKLVPNVTVKESEVDNLLRLIEGGMLKKKLVELNASCNPAFPVLTQTTKYQFDTSLYNFAFYVESNMPNKCILILYNTIQVLSAQGWGNNMLVTFTDIAKVK